MKFLRAIILVLTLIVASSGVEASQRRSAVVIAVEKASPAVVNISTVVQERVSPFFPFGRDDFFKDFFPDFFSREYTRSSLGSGVVINGKKGYIITNHHVVAGASEVKVITSEQEEYQAKVLGTDPRSDLAVLQVGVGKELPDIELGNSDDLMIGETVIAIGNPFGLSHTVTTGVISALERSVRGEERVYRHFIQTDASINPGNSGGPLLNIDGELIGINTAIYQKAQGIGFAIPVNKVKRIVDELIRAGEVRPLWLGLEIQELSPELRAHFALPKDEKGVLVSDVVEEGPAAKAGLKRGDIILTVEGNPVPSPEDYRNVLADYTPGDRLGLEVFYQGRVSAVSVEPSAFPLEMALDLVDRRLGISVTEPDRRTRQRYEIETGVMIKEVRKGSEAARIGLESGDLILKVNNQTVANLDEFKKAISQCHHLPSLRLVVQRGAYAYSLTLPF
ncbi:MAG: Do family serine endopeptidase [Deltaproteobacteria bacterium]